MPTSLPDFRVTSRVLVVEGKQPLTRREAAARLGCAVETLKKRLRSYRVPGQQVRVHLYELHLKIRPLAVSLQQCYSTPMPSPLRRLGAALAGRAPIDPLQSPPEGQKPFPPLDTPKPSPAPPRPPSVGAEAAPRPRGPTSVAPAHARLLTHAGQTQSIRAWACALGIDRRTLAYRLNHGWSTGEALGFTPRPRDRTAEQAASAEAHARVLLVDAAGHTIPRREAARRLGIKVASLTHRLRRYRPADGSNAKIPLSLLVKK